MAVSLTPGAISKIWTGKCTCASKDLKPMLQLTYIDCPQTLTEDDNQLRNVVLSDGSFSQFGYIANEIFISNKLQKGSIVQLTKFRLIEQIYEGEFFRVFGIDDPKWFSLSAISYCGLQKVGSDMQLLKSMGNVLVFTENHNAQHWYSWERRQAVGRF
ncbi:replication protein A 70 kDa DNA-binding subunit A-like protein [Tanacetum coccineum]